MKYPQAVSMPSAVSNWLDEQLEARGIDAVVYTRYILSLFHSVDLFYPEEDDLRHPKKEGRRSNRSQAGSLRSTSDWWRHAYADPERIKRSAAVECLLSASEQNCEIESLIDELCEKLKEANEEEDSIEEKPTAESAPRRRCDKKKISPRELAEKYYAAFPPLKSLSPADDSKLLALVPRWRSVETAAATAEASPVKRRSVKKAKKSASFSGTKSGYKDNSETMKAHSQARQRLNWSNNNNNRYNNFPSNNMKQQQALIGEPIGTFAGDDDRCLDVEKDIWRATDEDETNMYVDLPVDIKVLLDSPTPHDKTVELMNLANMRDTGNRRFIPYGTNIIGNSIWSTDQGVIDDNAMNASIEEGDFGLDLKFSSISIDNPTLNLDDWLTNGVDGLLENETRRNCRRRLFRGSTADDWRNDTNNNNNSNNKDVEDRSMGSDDDEKLMMNWLEHSLNKLNHDRWSSGFVEVAPGDVAKGRPSKPAFPIAYSNNKDEKEDLLTSERTHFKPISDKEVARCLATNVAKQPFTYADGSSFLICNNLDKVNYKRSESGAMLLENEFGQSKKYYPYKIEESSPSPVPDAPEFFLKFSVCQNDKSCQTEPPAADDEPPNQFDEIMNVGRTLADRPGAASEDEASLDSLLSTLPRPESVLDEVVWKYKGILWCEKCGDAAAAGKPGLTWNGAGWADGRTADADWRGSGLRSIWDDGEACATCLKAKQSCGGGGGRPSLDRRLREDITQDGEQLLSDLINARKFYMASPPPSAVGVETSNERKRRHSEEDGRAASWSFASRLEEDCLMQMAGLSDARAVTL